MAEPRVLITGAGRGLGIELVRQYVGRGWRVLAAVRDPAASDALRTEIDAADGRIEPVRLDVGDPASITAAFAAIERRHDALDLLINNAGVFDPSGEPFVPRHPAQQLGGLTLEGGLEVLRVNVLGAMLVSQRALPLLRAARAARIVNVTSELGALGEKTAAATYRNYYYDTSKAALNMVTRLLAADLERDGIPVVGLIPGWVRTDMGGPDAPLDAVSAMAEMTATIEAVTPAQTGAYLERDGRVRAW